MLPDAENNMPLRFRKEIRGRAFSGRLISSDWFFEKGTFSWKGMLTLPSTKTIVPSMNRAKDGPTSMSIETEISLTPKKSFRSSHEYFPIAPLNDAFSNERFLDK